MDSKIRHINYRAEPRLFANRALVSVDLLETVTDLIQGYEPLDAHQLLSIAVLAEAMVLNEEIIPVDDTLALDMDWLIEPTNFDSDFIDVVKILGKGNAIADYDVIGAG